MITQHKARKILHEGKAHGKPITERQRKFFGARASGYPIKKADGGILEDIYRTGTAKQLWEAWDVAQHSHFLIDHYDMFISELESDVNKYAQKFSHSSYDDLPDPIKKQIAIHHAMGIYKEGAIIKNQYKNKTAETVWDRWTPQQRIHFIADHEVLSIFKKEKNDVSHKKWSELPDAIEDIHIRGVISNHINSGQYIKGGRISSMKKKLEQRIDVLKNSLTKASPTAQKVMQKKINTLQAQLDHNPTLKERVAENKGKFTLEIPASYARSIYKQLWNIGIFSLVKKDNGSIILIVNNKSNLQKAYNIYAGILKEKGETIPALSKISN